MSNNLASAELEIGKTYDVLDGCGMIINRGVFKGMVRNEYENKTLLLFDFGWQREKKERYRYGGANFELVEFGNSPKFFVRIRCSYYGDKPNELHHHGVKRSKEWQSIG